GFHPFLVAQHVAQDAPEQADVFHERAFVVLRAPRGRHCTGRHAVFSGGGAGGARGAGHGACSFFCSTHASIDFSLSDSVLVTCRTSPSPPAKAGSPCGRPST